ncbi:MAG: HAE1 family hydrophobic/amphiphilic exporter-1 [Bradymonadia bacterium]
MSDLRGGTIARFSLARPITVAVLFLTVAVLGVISYRNISLELIPSGFTPPFLFVQVPTLRSSPADVEERIAIPLEEMLDTVRGVERLGTRIRGNSVSFIMEFADGTEMDLAYNQVRDRIDRVLPSLGDDIGQYYVWKYNPSDDPVVWFAVSFDETVENPGWLVDSRIIPAFERVPGVSRMEAFGVPSRVVAIEVDERQVEAAGISLSQLIERLQRDNFALAAGVVEDGGSAFPLRMVARYDSIEMIESLPVGNGLRLSDIASIEVQDRSERAVYRVDGQNSIFLAAYKESTANTVDVCRAVREVAERELAADPATSGASFAFFFDQGGLIEDSLGNLQETAAYGGVFAIIILFFFLRRLAMTLLVTLAIPSSLLITIVVMYFTGRTLNVLTLTGLMLAVGMVVDNAIVVVESIQGRLLEGDPPLRAALVGTAEVSLAVLVATLTTVVVFVPLILMSGGETLSFYLSNIGMPVCVSLLASLFVSLLLLPLTTSRLLRAGRPPRVKSVEWLGRVYRKALGWMLNHRFEAVLTGVVCMASISIPMSQVSETDQSEPNINDFRILLDLPEQLSWSERVEMLHEFEESLLDRREELGIKHLLVRMGGEWGRPQIRAFLDDPEERELERDEIIERATSALPRRPGVDWSLTWDRGAGTSGVTVQVVGPDSVRLAELSEEVTRRLRLIPGVTSVQADSADAGQQEIQYTIDPERSLRMGLSAFVVGGSIDFALRGRRLPSFHNGGEELPVTIEGNVEELNEMDEIEQLPLPSPVDRVVLGEVSRSSIVSGYAAIDRENRRTVSSLTITTSREDLERLGADIDAVLDGMDWPRGYGVELGARFESVDEGARQRSFALLLSIVCVFLLMGVLFESVTLPFSILLSIPFAFVGVYWMLFLTGTAFDLMAGVGLIILVGIVVNNAIVLVDRVSELRKQGNSRSEAILLAGEQRLRPILMTALTTIFGLIPMALGTSSLVGIPYSPLGRAVIGGLVASTLLTLFVVPLVYTLLDDGQRHMQLLWGATKKP